MRVPIPRKTKRPDIRKQAAAAGGLLLAAGGAAVAFSRGARAFIGGKTRAAANAVTPSPARDYDDVTLARKVETEIFRSEDAPKSQVNVNVENGVVYLRGQVKNPEEMKALEVAARKVEGVKDVNNLLHTKGTEPLTKVEGKTRSLAER
jgi:hypothetical protein